MMKMLFYVAIGAYYAVLAVIAVRALLLKREERKVARMSEAERKAYEKYWKWCF